MAQATRLNKKDKAEASSGSASFRLREAALILSLALAAYLLLSLSSYHPTDPGWSTTGTNDVIANKGGIVKNYGVQKGGTVIPCKSYPVEGGL